MHRPPVAGRWDMAPVPLPSSPSLPALFLSNACSSSSPALLGGLPPPSWAGDVAVTASGCLQGLAHASASVQGRPSAREGRISPGGCATAPGGLAFVPEDVFDAWLCTNSSLLKTRAPQASGDAGTAIRLPGKPMQAERVINA